MKNYETPIEMLFEKAEDCGTTTIELLKLKAIDSSADFASTLAVKMILFTVITLFVIIANIGVALWIGDLLGKSYYGFFYNCSLLCFDYGFVAFVFTPMGKSANQ